MNLNNRKEAFVKLGQFLTKYTAKNPLYTDDENVFVSQLDQAITAAIIHNGWFTKEDIYFNLNQWGSNLTEENLSAWLSHYDFSAITPKTVAIIMAGNIPLVGFHDLLCVLLSGHKALIKQSSKDKQLTPCLMQFLIAQEASLSDSIRFTDEKLENFDAVIATGSNNTARYFEYYFSKKPRIIRKNRNSVAVFTGEEKPEDLKDFGEDLFRYFGLGCRNVSKIFVPKNYDFTSFFETIYPWNPLINSHKYANNYDYNKAVYLMSEFKMLENGFFILKEDKKYASPIACLFYEYYDSLESLHKKLQEDSDQIQCIVSKNKLWNGIKFGQTQRPKLNDYADGVDTLAFLSKL